jgi:hypothetical protein
MLAEADSNASILRQSVARRLVWGLLTLSGSPVERAFDSLFIGCRERV